MPPCLAARGLFAALEAERDRLRAALAKIGSDCPYRQWAAIAREALSGEYCAISEVETSAGCPACAGAPNTAHVPPCSAAKANEQRIPHFPSNETLKRQILSDPDDEPSAGNGE